MSIHLFDPPRECGIEIERVCFMQFIQRGDICFHQAHASATRAAAFFSEYLCDAERFENLLHCGFSEAGDLSAFFSSQLIWFKRQPLFLRSLRDDESYAKTTFV